MPRSYDARKDFATARPTTAETTVRWTGPTALLRLRRLAPARLDATGAAILLAAAMTGLALMKIQSAGSAQGVVRDEGLAGAGIIVRYEVTHLWLPESLRDLADARSQSQIVRGRDELRRDLGLRNRQGLRYAVTMRGHQVDGGHSDIHFIRRPGEDPGHFQELLDSLADINGTPDRDPAADFPGPSVHVIPDELLDREPREIIAELQRAR